MAYNFILSSLDDEKILLKSLIEEKEDLNNVLIILRN